MALQVLITGARLPVFATGFPDVDTACAVPIPWEWAGFTKSYNLAGLLRNSRDTQLRAKPRCTQTEDKNSCPLVHSFDQFAFYVQNLEKSSKLFNDSCVEKMPLLAARFEPMTHWPLH